MPPKSLAKVQKSIGRKPGARKGLHANSRDSHRLLRAADRDARVARTERVRRGQNTPLVERLSFFQDALGSNDAALSSDEAHELVRRWIARNDDQLAELKAARRPGRPPSAWESAASQQRDTEQAEYRSGFWMPDLFDAATVEGLRRWEGQWTGLALLKFVRLDADGVVGESAFPPRKG